MPRQSFVVTIDTPLAGEVEVSENGIVVTHFDVGGESPSPVRFAEEVVAFVLDWGSDPDDPEFRDEDIAVNGYDEHNRVRIATDLARAKFGASIGDVPPRYGRSV